MDAAMAAETFSLYNGLLYACVFGQSLTKKGELLLRKLSATMYISVLKIHHLL